MTVEAYIPRDPSGCERTFEYAHERRATIELVKAAWRIFHTSPRLYAIVANVKYPPADAVVIAEDGIGIIEFKDYGGLIQGDEESKWTAISSTGETVHIMAGSHVNPFQQVKAYRGKLRHRLERMIQGSDVQLPVWLHSWRTYLQATVCFTQEIEVEYLEVHQPWFQVTTLDTVPEWIATLVFGSGRKLIGMQVKLVASRILEGRHWTEIETMMSPGLPYGCLWVLEEGKESWRLMLDHSDMRIGRALECGPLMLEESYYLVSREHARIRREGSQVVIHDGCGQGPSTNKTYVNGKEVDTARGCVLHEGDRISLGGCVSEDCTHPPPGVCLLRFHRFRGEESRRAETIRPKRTG